MKKTSILGLILLLALTVVLSACTGKKETTTTATSVPTTAAPTTTTTAVVETTTTAAPQEPITLKFATSFEQTEPGGKAVQHFCDYVEEETAGVVTFDIYFSGALGAGPEELGLVSSQQVDMVSLGQQLYGDKLPLLTFPAAPPPDVQTGLEYVDKVIFQDRDTAALIQAEAARNHVLYLGVTSGGAKVIVAKAGFSALADLAGKKLGVAGPKSAFEALGFGIVESPLADTYKNLSTDVIEAVDVDLATALRLKLYEVAQSFTWDGTYTGGSVLTVNLDSWDQLAPDTQRIMREAAKDTAQFSLDLDVENTQVQLKSLTDAGVTVASLSPADQSAWWKNWFAGAAADCVARAAKLGVAGNMKIVLEAAAGYSGLTWTP